MSRKVVNKGGIGVGAPYDFPGYEYDPVNDTFKDLETGRTFTKNGNAKLEASKSFSVTENGSVIITPSPTYDAMEKVVLSVNVQGGGGNVEANKESTIDVSEYTHPVVIIPSQGKGTDYSSMAQVTVTLENIPNNKAYAWSVESSVSPGLTSDTFLNVDEAPENQAAFEEVKYLNTGNGSIAVDTLSGDSDVYSKVSASSFTVENDGVTLTYTRAASHDLTLWN